MRTRLIIAGLLILLGTTGLKAQFVVTDPINLAQGIVNSANEIIQTSSTVSNVIKNFQEVKKVYQQGKEYYDKLKAVHDLVKDAYKVQQTLLMIGEISDIYVSSFELMLQDEYYTAEELESHCLWIYQTTGRRGSYLQRDERCNQQYGAFHDR